MLMSGVLVDVYVLGMLMHVDAWCVSRYANAWGVGAYS